MNPLYLDNNATTPLHPAVWEAMRPCWTDIPGNPASSHQAGRRARQALETARETVARILDADPDEIVFTSGATEANNLAVFGLARDPPARITVSPIEHPSVIEPIRHLAERGFTIDWLPVDREGTVQVERLHPDTRLLCVMLANHETGAVQSSVLRTEYSVPLHCDAVQAVGKLPVRFHELGVSTLSLSAHKFHGPKGVGALLVRRGVKLRPLLYGGHQQRGKRPGTEPVALAVGLAAALELWEREAVQRTAHVLHLRQLFLERIRAQVPNVVLNGPGAGGVSHTVNLSFPGCQADALLMSLDLAGVCCSTGSACSSGSLLPSPVLQAMGAPDEVLRSAMRFSLSPMLSEAEVEEAARRVVKVVERLRRTG